MKPMRFIVGISLGFALSISSLVVASGADSNFINYQGRLTDAAGTPLDGVYLITFSIWNDSTSGTQLWAETLSVTVTDGLFSADLGRVHPVSTDIFGGIDPWFLPRLQIEVAGEAMSPRTPLGKSPSSFITNRVLGDITTAPGEVMVQLQPEPPSPGEVTRIRGGEVAFGLDPLFGREVAAFDAFNGVMFADSASGDTVSRYGPGDILMVQLQPELPSPPEFTRMGPGGVVFGVDPWFDKRMAEVCNAGIILSDSATGDTLAEYGPDKLVLHSPEGEFERDAWKCELSSLWFEMRKQGTSESEYVGSTKISTYSTVFTMKEQSSPEITLAEYGGAGVALRDTVGANSVHIVANLEEVAATTGANEAILGGGGVLFREAGTAGGFASEHTAESVVFSTISGTAEDTSVIVSVEGIVVDTVAGPTKAIAAGEYYKDNAIVAWARVNAGATSIEEFGVTSVTRTTTGYYTIVIDASLSSGLRLIPTAVAEVDSQPTGASSVRLVSVSQQSSGNTFRVFINDGNYAPVDNDFVFMATGR